jgi:kynurenine formamidase
VARELSDDEIHHLLHGRANWGRWGADDQVGALNLITDAKRVEAARLVRSGRTVSLSHPVPTGADSTARHPAEHRTKTAPRGVGGIATDYYGLEYHGTAFTHLDALCHAWDDEGMWQGRDPEAELTPGGSRWGGVEHWRTGIVTRGVLLDVPRFRGEPFVTRERPVRGDELEHIAAAQGVAVTPGDAVLVYSGRDAWDASHRRWGSEHTPEGAPLRPGLHASCLAFLRDHDCAVLGWDMLDAAPNPWGIPWAVHGAIFAYGMALIDNCDLAGLSAACTEQGRFDFMLTVAPLVVPGGTGSPANPLATF